MKIRIKEIVSLLIGVSLTACAPAASSIVQAVRPASAVALSSTTGVISWYPLKNQTAVPTDTTVQVSFSAPISTGSDLIGNPILSIDHFTVYNAVTGWIPDNGQYKIVLSSDLRQATISFLTGLDPATDYIVWAQGILAADGNAVLDSYTTFRTQDYGTGKGNFEVVDVFPHAKNGTIAANAPLDIEFSAAVYPNKQNGDGSAICNRREWINAIGVTVGTIGFGLAITPANIDVCLICTNAVCDRLRVTSRTGNWANALGINEVLLTVKSGSNSALDLQSAVSRQGLSKATTKNFTLGF